MGCLHRFCKECIDKSMRLGYFTLSLSHSNTLTHINMSVIFTKLFAVRNKECPACRKHCASRRSLRDDLVFDKIIGSLFPDLEKYEKEVPLSLSLLNALFHLFSSFD